MGFFRNSIFVSNIRAWISVVNCLRLTILFAVVAFVSPLPTESPAPDPNKPWELFRLPSSVRPRHYVITLNPNFYTKEDSNFTGIVKIEMEVSKPTKHILIHVKNINITSHQLRKSTKEVIPTGVPFEYPQNEFWILPVSNNLLPNGIYHLELKYVGRFVGMDGFYKSQYLDPITKRIRYLVSTQFQPLDARSAFPCFDEPEMKAQFTVNIIHKNSDGYFALSNMPQKSTVVYKDRGYNLTSFERSVTMSTYLVAFVVCDYIFKEGTSNGNKPFRVYAPKHKRNQMKYGLETGIKILNFFEKYFDMPYALPKLDMIAIPSFRTGAMENWGLIIYREDLLLYNETLHSISYKQRLNFVIAHEVAHMWFGNVVTMAWWDDLWLNEAFASFAAFKGVKIAEPSWNTDAMARSYNTRQGMSSDDVISSFPIISKRDTLQKIKSTTNPIIYKKGQAVILMLEGWIGKTAFKVGIQKYIKKFQFKNAITSQLWDILSQMSNLPVSKIMDTWTLQMGYPVVNISNTNPPVATQSWFLLDPTSRPNASASPYNYSWNIGISYKSSESPRTEIVWLNQGKNVTIRVNISFLPCDSWILLNTANDGFYRVNYPTILWKRYPSMIINKEMPTTSDQRIALLSDVMNLARSGHVSYDIALPMLNILKTERDHYVWLEALNSLFFLIKMTSGLPFYLEMRKFVQSLTTNIYGSFEFDVPSSLQQSMLRERVVALACASGLRLCRADMFRLFKRWRNGKNIPLEIRSSILQYGLLHSDTQATWETMWRLYQQSDDDVEKGNIMNALASTKHPWLIQKLLSFAMNESLIKPQDFFKALSFVAFKPVGHLVYWIWFRENWPSLVERFGLESVGLGRAISDIAPQFNNEVQLNEMKNFFALYPDAGVGSLHRERSLNLVEANLRWIKVNKATLSGWLNANIHI